MQPLSTEDSALKDLPIHNVDLPWALELAAPAGVKVWTFSLAEPAVGVGEEDASLLDAQEAARAKNFVFERDRVRYVRAHAGLRRLLGRMLDMPSRELQFEAGSHGKPSLRGRAGRLDFNLSHGGDLCAVAVAHGRSVGVDIEPWREISGAAELSRTVFSPAEQAAWSLRPTVGQQRDFLRLWTRKEAVLKAVGLGLAVDPCRVHVGLQIGGCTVDVPVGERLKQVVVHPLEGCLAAALAVAWI